MIEKKKRQLEQQLEDEKRKKRDAAAKVQADEEAMIPCKELAQATGIYVDL
jgi:hypothetical protein